MTHHKKNPLEEKRALIASLRQQYANHPYFSEVPPRDVFQKARYPGWSAWSGYGTDEWFLPKNLTRPGARWLKGGGDRVLREWQWTKDTHGMEGAIVEYARRLLAEVPPEDPMTWPRWYIRLKEKAFDYAMMLQNAYAENDAENMGSVWLTHMVRGTNVDYANFLAKGDIEICVSSATPWCEWSDQIVLIGHGKLRMWFASDVWSIVGKDGKTREATSLVTRNCKHDEGFIAPKDVSWKAVSIGYDAVRGNIELAKLFATVLGVPLVLREAGAQESVEGLVKHVHHTWSEDDFDIAEEVHQKRRRKQK